MPVWAISDLHLSHARDLSRDQYAARWRDHAAKLEAEWRAVVSRDDLVLLPGDISMARNHREVQPDLAWLARLPGSKVISPGNHDGWFNRVDKVRPMLRPRTLAVRGDAIRLPGLVVSGARGADIEDTPNLPAALAELDRALAHAASLRQADDRLVVLWHYPPFDKYGQSSAVTERLHRAQATACVYGHLHTEAQWSRAVQGVVEGVRYACVAADAVGFRPLRLQV